MFKERASIKSNRPFLPRRKVKGNFILFIIFWLKNNIWYQKDQTVWQAYRMGVMTYLHERWLET